MKRLTSFAAAFALVCTAATAQPAAAPDKKIETVIVTAPKFHAGVTPSAVAHDFVRSFATPTVLREGIARWQIAICPDFEGLAPQYVKVMDDHFHAIAAQAGAPMKQKGCRPNLSILFTAQPQAYLDALHARNVEALGYHGALAITHPIQAWYVTGITDIDGHTEPDQDAMGIVSSPLTDPGCKSVACWTQPTLATNGWQFHPDATSDLLGVTILVDADKTGHYTVSEIADYVAMLALSRTEDYDDCQLMPSITNLLSSNCDDKLKPSAITASDLAYLRGVYKMDPGARLQIQRDEIAAEMQKALGGQ